MLDIVSEAKNERAFAATLELISNLEKIFYRSGKTSAEMLNAKVISFMTTLTFEPVHPFFDEFHFQIHRIFETGSLIYYKPLQNRRYDEEVPPLVLSMKDLHIGFTVCCAPLILSVVAFVVEFAIPKFKLLIKNIQGALTAKFVFAAFLEEQHV